MKLIEFSEGHLKGLALPIEPQLILTGRKDNLAKDMFSISEFLTSDTSLELKNKEGSVYLAGWKKKPIKLIENTIYSISGLQFFIFTNGKRNPKLNRIYIKKYLSIMLVFLLFNFLLTMLILIVMQYQQNKKISQYLNIIDSGYIKEGQLYVFSEDIKEKLPQDWIEHTQFINDKHYSKLTNLNVDIISTANKKVPFTITDKEFYTEIIIDYSEKNMNIMKVFGENGMTYQNKDNIWLVDDIAKASRLLNSIGYSNEISKLQTLNNKSDIIDAKHFPYSIFVTSQGRSYIYDQQSRYWVGGIVPGIGRIESITKDRIIFKENSKNKVYFIPK